MHSAANCVGTPNADSGRLVEGELRLATTPDEDPETDRSDVRLHGKRRRWVHVTLPRPGINYVRVVHS
jgi:hypothetical protein